MANISQNDLNILRSMLGTSVSGSPCIQVGVDNNLPIKFPMRYIHYEYYEDYKNHAELHIEDNCYQDLCKFLADNLPNNANAKTEGRSFCQYAYVLQREIKVPINIEELGKAFIELRNIVEPVLIKYCERIADDFELAAALGEYYEKQNAQLPFHINVIDELHANENAHTRILTQLLKYKDDGKHVILESFLRLLQSFDKTDIEGATIDFNHDWIDCLIKKDGKFAVIIENKIHYAADQEKQIERYVTTVENYNIPIENIWVVYLTRDGRKEVNSRSLTDEVKRKLENRFEQMNYRDHILPWLKEDILPNCKLKEEWLVSALKQYVDHLEGLFNCRESNKAFVENMEIEIFKKIGCSGNMSSREIHSKLDAYWNKLEALQGIVSTSMESLTNPVIERLKTLSIAVLEQVCPDVKFVCIPLLQLNSGCFQIRPERWTKNVHFEWIPLSKKDLLDAKEYTFVLHVEQSDISSKFKGVLNDDDLQPQIKTLKLKSDDNGWTFYQNPVPTLKSFSDMSDEEMKHFLEDAYKDVNDIQKFVSKHVLQLK